MSRNRVFRVVLIAAVLAGTVLGAGCKKRVEETPVPTPPPEPVSISKVDPPSGPADQSTAIVITGKGFKQGASVTIGTTPATDVVIDSGTQIHATVPSGLPTGPQDVKVANPEGRSGLLKGGFLVVAPAPAPKEEDCTIERVYFDFDVATLSDEARLTLQRDAECLKKKGARKIEVEGHADERGSTAYNLALGQRRADEVRNYLYQLGITNITTISYGEEKPLDPASNEYAWSKNRRAEINILE